MLAYFIIFLYWPMYGVSIAFKDYKAGMSILGAPWAGLKHFQRFFSSVYFERTVGNTLTISLYSLVVGFPMPILLALMLNEVRQLWFKKTVQTVTYAPYFISTVVMASMILIFLRPDTGLINILIEKLGGESIPFMTRLEYFKTIYVLSGVWQSTGWGSIIYIATLSSLDQEMFEAATVDGATKMQKILHITLPCLMPTAIILLILNMGSLMSVGFEKVFLLQSDLNLRSSEVISTYVYKQGILGTDYSYSAAIGLFNSLINFILLVVVNQISKRMSEVSLF